MCNIALTYIPDKHRAFWDKHYKAILWGAGEDYQVFMLLLAIGYVK